MRHIVICGLSGCKIFFNIISSTDVLAEDQFGFRRGKGTRNAIGMLRIISERTLETDEELFVCFVDWQKAFD
jgi:hypothetical protein